MTAESIGWLEQFCHVWGNLFRRDHRVEPLDHFAVSTDQELLEVPPDVSALGLLAQPLVELAGAVAVDLDLAEHREGDAELGGGELEHLGIAARLLCTELVAGEGEDGEPGCFVAVMERTQTCVLAGEASIARNVDDEEHPAAVGVECHLITGDRRHGEVVQV